MRVDEVNLRVKATWQGEDVKRNLNQLQQTIASISQTTKQLAGVAGFAGLAYSLKQILATAIQVNVQFERASTGVAALLYQMGRLSDAQGRILQGTEKFNAALVMSRQLFEEVNRVAAQTILETQELVEYFQTSLGYGLARGMTPRQTLEAVSLIAQAGRVLGLPAGYPIVSELRAILTGQQLESSQIARATLMTERQLESLTGERLLGYIRERLVGIVSAQEQFARTLEGRWSTLVSEWKETLREISTDLVSALSDSLAIVLEAVRRWRASGGVQSLREMVRSATHTLIDVVRMIWEALDWMKKNNLLGIVAGTVGGRMLLTRLGLGGTTATAAALGAVSLYQAPRLETPWRGLAFVGGGALLGGAIGSMVPVLGTGAGILGGGIAGAATWFATEMRPTIERWLGISRPTETSSASTTPQGLPPLTPAPQLTFTPLPIEVETDRVKKSTQAERRAQQQKLEAQRILRDVRLSELRRNVSRALDEAREQGYSETSVKAVFQAVEAWAKERRKLIVAEGQSPELVSALAKEAEQEIAQYTEDIRNAIVEGRTRLQTRKLEEQRALQQLWMEWRRELLSETVAGRAQLAAERAVEQYIRLGPVPAFIAAGVSAARVWFPEMERLREQRERETQQRLREEYTRRVESIQVSQKAWEDWLSGYLRMPRGLSLQAREKLYVQRLSETMGFLSSMIAMGYVGPEVSAVLARLNALYAQWEENVKQRQRMFWDWLAETMESSVREAFLRLGSELVRNTKSWWRSLKDFATSLGRMVERAILEAIYNQVIRVAVERLIAWIVNQISKVFGGGGGAVAGVTSLAAGVSVSPVGKGLGYAAAGAQIGAAIGGPAGAVVGAAIGFLGGLLGLQHGGGVVPRYAYLVGEKGPELFVPYVPGRVIPARQETSSRVTNVYVNLPAGVDTQVVRVLSREMAQTLRIMGW